jgi:hypothetical protein
MKMMSFKKAFIRINLLILFVLVQTACSDEEEQPAFALLTLSAQMDAPQTRATAGNNWDGSEEVQVSINGGTATAFTVATDGTLTPNTPLYWTGAISARAWHPAEWTMRTNQGTEAGLQAADFIFAPTVTGITSANFADEDKQLTFSHKTAKVTATLTAGTNVTDVSGATVSFYGYTSGSINYDTESITGDREGWIISCNTEDDSYTALLIPRNLTSGTDFIEVTFGGSSYYYKLPADKDIEAGKAYTYNITLP